MIDEAASVLTLRDFGGAQTATDAAEVSLGNALIARNVEYLPHQVATRTGFGLASASFDSSTTGSMFNWIGSLGNFLVRYKTSTGDLLINTVTAPAAAGILTGALTGSGATHASAGSRLYSAIFNSSGRGTRGGIVTSFQSSTFFTDVTFPGPITYTPAAPTEPGVGVITVGIHRIGYRIEYRSGFIGRPNPDTGVGTPSYSTFQPITFTASGLKNCSITLNTTWPAGAVKVHIVMTPVSNLNRYIMVPAANAAVVGGTLQSVTIVFSISDDDLLNNPAINEVSTALNFLTETTGGTAPFSPYVVFTHGNRMGYVTTVNDNVGNATGAIYMSDIGAFQQISADQHLIQLPGLLDITTSISLDGGVYIFGPQWTYHTTDNGSFPVTWPTPALVDGRRGTLAIRGVEVSPAGNYAWVADRLGLFLFTGAYSDLPISYLQGGAEWNRINWAVAYTLQIKDHTERKKVVVAAALDSATNISHLLTWDYSNGRDFRTVKFSLDTITSTSIGAIEIVQNTLPSGAAAAAYKAKELWVASSTAAGIFRQLNANDTNPYRDNGSGIDSQYRSGFFRSEELDHLAQPQGAHIRVRGSGTLTITAYTFDYLNNYSTTTALSTAPGPDFLLIDRGGTLGEGVAYDFAVNAADAYFILSYVRHYFVPWAMQS